MDEKKPIVFISNDFEVLADLLRENLFFRDTKPFSKKIVLLPLQNLKNPLMMEFLKDGRLDIVTGIHFMELGSGMQSILKLATSQTLVFPPIDLLSIHIEHLLTTFLQRDEDVDFTPLFEYFDFQGEITLKIRKKIQSLAHGLSKEFIKYGKFGGTYLEIWKKEKGWQQRLWALVFSTWNYPYQILEKEIAPSQNDVEIHLFALPFLPKLNHLFFEKLSRFWKVHYYQLSFCKNYWTDICTEQERFYILKKAKEKVRDELNSYLIDHHPLLANLGKLNRETERFFEDRGFLLEEHYTEDPVRIDAPLLHTIQNDILNGQPSRLRTISKDDSLLFYPASSKYREVEILYSTLVEWTLQKKSYPSDIQVLAPDISLYAPYIQLIFGSKESPFDFEIQDLERHSQSQFFQGFFKLLSLKEDRFTPSSILTLFSNPYFQQKFHLEEQELSLFQKWVSESEIKWGVTPLQRNEILSMIHPERKMLDEGSSGTWEHSFTTWLRSLAFIPSEESTWNPTILDLSQAEFLGKYITLIHSLQGDLDFIEKTSMTIREWTRYLNILVNTYFYLPEEENNEYRFFEEKLLKLDELGKILPFEEFRFSTIKRFLERSMIEKTGRITSKQWEAIHFGSLKLGGFVASKLIYLLGMNETDFPRKEINRSIDEHAWKEEIDYTPSHSEEDRSIFLHALFLAKENLKISYLSINEKDGKEQSPSSLVQELLAYLDSFFVIDGKKPSLEILCSHPPFAFHSSYFEKEGSHPHYDKAIAYYFPNVETPAPFFPEFLYFTPLPTTIENITLDLKHLSQFARHPIRSYFNQTLGIYLRSQEDDEEEFIFSPLRQSILTQTALRKSFEETFSEAEWHGKLPLGRFKEVAKIQVEEKVLPLHSHLAKLGIQNEIPTTINLRMHVEKIEKIDENRWICPPLKIPLPTGKEVIIEGTLPNITSKGLLFYGTSTLTDRLKIWPLYLVFCLSAPDIFSKNLLFLKSNDRLHLTNYDPFQALIDYLYYYQVGLQTPSPLLPAWGESFLKKGYVALEKTIHQTLRFPSFQDPYITRALSNEDLFSTEVIYETWAPLLQSTLKPLIETDAYETI